MCLLRERRHCNAHPRIAGLLSSSLCRKGQRSMDFGSRVHILREVISMTYSYFLSQESPQADGFLWATFAEASRIDAKLIMVCENPTGITLIYDKELSQERILGNLFASLTTNSLYTTQSI